ncbi:hypothetical protein E4U55_004739 [Claviceps digitariae]|nr:hypothetical protein E4U55_004739 [Claviceps digitariae]
MRKGRDHNAVCRRNGSLGENGFETGFETTFETWTGSGGGTTSPHGLDGCVSTLSNSSDRRGNCCRPSIAHRRPGKAPSAQCGSRMVRSTLASRYDQQHLWQADAAMPTSFWPVPRLLLDLQQRLMEMAIWR